LSPLLNDLRIPTTDEAESYPTVLCYMCRKVYPGATVGIKLLPTSERPCRVAAL